MASPHSPKAPRTSSWRPLLGNVIAIVCLAALAAYQSRLHHEQQARISADNLAQLLGRQMSGAIEKIDLSLHTIALEAERQHARGGLDAKFMERFLAEQISVLPDVLALYIVDDKGAFRYSRGTIPPTGANIADRDYFLRLRSDPGAGMAVSGPHLGRASQQWVMVFARRLKRPDGSFSGTVQASVTTDHFREMLSMLNVGAHGFLELRTEDASLVARLPHLDNTGKDADRRVSAEYRQSLQAHPEQGSFVAASPLDNIERTVAYRQLPGLPLYISVGLAPQDYLAAWQEEVAQLAGMVALFGLIASWLLRSARRADETRQASQRLLQEAVDSVATGFSIFDSEDRLVVCNAAARDFLGHSRNIVVPGMRFEDILRAAVAQAYHPNNCENIDEWIRERMHLHQAADGKPFEMTLDDGRHFLIIERRTASGHTVSNHIDITELAQHRHHLEQLVETRTEELKAASDRFRIFVDQSPAAIAMFDQDLRYIAASGRWIEDHASGHGSLAGQALYDMHPDIPEHWKQAFQDALAGIASKGKEDAWPHGDGSRRWLRWAIHPWIDESGRVGGAIIAVEDFTEIKQAELALAHEQELLSRVIDNIPVLLCLFNPKHRGVTLNRHAEKVLGWTTADANEEDFTTRLFPDVPRREAVSRFMEPQGSGWREWMTSAEDGSAIPIDWATLQLSDGTGVAIGIDLRERKASKRKLARHAERQALLLDVASNLLQAGHDRASLAQYVFERVSSHLEADVCFNFRFDEKEDGLELVNCFGVSPASRAAACRLEPGQAICGTVAVRRTPLAFDAERIAQDELGAFVRGLGVRAYTCHPLLAQDGSLLGTFAMGSRRRDRFAPDELDFLQTIAYFMSLAWERHLAEIEVQRLNVSLERRVEERTAELEASNRELQSFTYAASHDIKGPLGRINSFAGLLESNYRDRLEGDGLMFLDFIRRNAARLTNLIDDLLAHAQIDQRIPDVHPLDLPAAVARIVNEKEDEILEAGAQVRLDLPPELPTVNANPHGLAQVLRNLLGNALKYSAGSTPPAIEIGGRQAGGRCVLWIRDNGIGFDMAYHDKIFEIFRRLHTYDEFPGSGIGLALVKKAMERMGGKVWAKSAPGRGATFFLELQSAPAPASQPGTPTNPEDGRYSPSVI